MTSRDATHAEQLRFTQELIDAGLLIATGVPGVYGKGRDFEELLERFDQLITRTAISDGAEFMRFPPVLPRKTIERSDYLDSFPHLAGSIFSFSGSEAQHRELMQRVRGGQDWSGLQTMTDVVLTPAACYPVYPQCQGTLAEGGRLVDVSSWCFRHEPSDDPARLQMFRLREFVRLGAAEGVRQWRDLWMERGIALLRGLGLPAEPVVASDPFFGRGGRMLAVNQREQQLKFEVVVPICSTEWPTAVVSFNYHQDHFGSLFAIQTAQGQVAHTACLGFGMERVVLALFKTHGLDLRAWPAPVRAQLWPESRA